MPSFSPKATPELLLVKGFVGIDVHGSDHCVVNSNICLSISHDDSIIVLVRELRVLLNEVASPFVRED